MRIPARAELLEKLTGTDLYARLGMAAREHEAARAVMTARKQDRIGTRGATELGGRVGVAAATSAAMLSRFARGLPIPQSSSIRT